jgi:hypothetical protein
MCLPLDVLVAGVVFLGRKILKKENDVEELMEDFGVSEKEVKNCGKELAILISDYQKCVLSACRRKFRTKEKLGVSRLKISVKDLRSEIRKLKVV